VLGDNGYGDLSDIMAAIDYVATNARTLRVNVINMSLGGGGSGGGPGRERLRSGGGRLEGVPADLIVEGWRRAALSMNLADLGSAQPTRNGAPETAQFQALGQMPAAQNRPPSPLPAASDPICASIKAANDRGIIVAVAAGNDGRDLRNYSPAACAAAVTVSAVDAGTDTPASFSNWAPTNADSALLRRLVAAPGVDVVSTLPDGSYASYSGTSMATPHVAGVAARCFAAGECSPDAGAQNRERFLNAVWAKYNSDSGYRWNDGGSPVASGKYYGPLVWADKW
jgi:subtilisin family serine protease